MVDAQKMLDALADLMTEDILAMSDDEICAELMADGLDPEAEAESVRRIANRAIAHVHGTSE